MAQAGMMVNVNAAALVRRGIQSLSNRLLSKQATLHKVSFKIPPHIPYNIARGKIKTKGAITSLCQLKVIVVLVKENGLPSH